VSTRPRGGSPRKGVPATQVSAGGAAGGGARTSPAEQLAKRLALMLSARSEQAMAPPLCAPRAHAMWGPAVSGPGLPPGTALETNEQRCAGAACSCSLGGAPQQGC
jgi:hypothetical protein